MRLGQAEASALHWDKAELHLGLGPAARTRPWSRTPPGHPQASPRAPAEFPEGLAPQTPQEGPPHGLQKQGRPQEVLGLPLPWVPFFLPYIQRFIFYISCNLRLGRSHRAPSMGKRPRSPRP